MLQSHVLHIDLMCVSSERWKINTVTQINQLKEMHTLNARKLKRLLVLFINFKFGKTKYLIFIFSLVTLILLPPNCNTDNLTVYGARLKSILNFLSW